MNSSNDSQPFDPWGWNSVYSDYQQKLNRHLEENSKALNNHLVSLYLINKCTGCTENPCLNYHIGQIPRRPLVYLGNQTWNYSSKKCYKPSCKLERCPYAHTTEEIFYHPEKFRKTPCNYPLINGKCSKFAELCPFMHAQIGLVQEKKVKFELERFKTEKCEILGSHSYKECFFYHEYLNSSDRRRHLEEFKYYAELCNHGKECPDGDSCKFCHTEHELKYHPTRFKTKPCRCKENCVNKEACPYFHTECNDRVYEQTGEIEELMKKSEELCEKIQKFQERNSGIQKFWCSLCERTESVVAMSCGHTRCGECCGEGRCRCRFCQMDVEVFVKFRFW